MKFHMFLLAGFMVLFGTTAHASYETDGRSPMKRSRGASGEPGKDRAAVQREFIDLFAQGKAVLTADGVRKLGFDKFDPSLMNFAHQNDKYAYLVLNLFKDGYLPVEKLEIKYRQILININIRANRGDVFAKHNLGFFYLYGIGQPKNEIFAHQCLFEAAEKDHTLSCALLEEIETKMKEQERQDRILESMLPDHGQLKQPIVEMPTHEYPGIFLMDDDDIWPMDHDE